MLPKTTLDRLLTASGENVVGRLSLKDVMDNPIIQIDRHQH